MEVVIPETLLIASVMSDLFDMSLSASTSAVSGWQHASNEGLFKIYLLSKLTKMPAATGKRYSVIRRISKSSF